jgi:ribosome maturation factor RimP
MVIRGERTGIELKFFELCTEVTKEQGLDLYDLEYISGSQTLRLFVMNPETNTAVIEDCMKVDRALTPFTDELEWMPEALVLEVSSPGLFRELTSKDHFNKAVGSDVLLIVKTNLLEKTYPGLPKKLAGQKKFVATLTSSSDEGIEVKAMDYLINLKFEDIKKANLETALKHE